MLTLKREHCGDQIRGAGNNHTVHGRKKPRIDQRGRSTRNNSSQPVTSTATDLISTLSAPVSYGFNHDKPDELPSDEDEPEDDGQFSSLAVIGPQVKRRSLQEDGLRPKIWAVSRQEVCEAFPWFRSYQGGVYHTGGVVKGYLLSAYSSSRDIFHDRGKLIISHGGGKSDCVRVNKNGQVPTQADDQLEQDLSVKALLNTHEQNRALALLIDDKYPSFPYDLAGFGAGYAVLGWYTIAHAWAERETTPNGRQVVRYKFAFQWCEDQGPPWWIKDNTAVDRAPAREIKKLKRRRVPEKSRSTSISEEQRLLPKSETHAACLSCRKESPQVYAIAWICLNPTCKSFWVANTGPIPQGLDYNPEFLLPVTKTADRAPTFQSTLPSSADKSTDYSYSRGFHCPKCGRLSCRFKWERWECSSCEHYVPVPAEIQTRKDLHRNLSNDYVISDQDEIKPVCSWRTDHDFGHTFCQLFSLTRGGSIIQLRYRPMKMDSDADIIFREYQEQASNGKLPLRRHPIKTHKLKGPLLAGYFSQNCGEPYQYVGGADSTIPFGCNETPGAVAKARDFLEDHVTRALKKKVEFNEVLSAAYMEKQKMSFHGDDEEGLGPLVAGLSLGSPAYMHFRVHTPKCKKAPASAEQQKSVKNIATFTLRHGDILVMDGHEVQKFYEHAVVPTNFRIAATARFIDSSNAKQMKRFSTPRIQ